jgi:nucleoside-diphosphate-sugar epimerase
VNAVAQMQAAREAAPDAVVEHASTRQFYGWVEKLPVERESAGGAVRRRATIDIGSYHADDSAFRAAAGWEPKVGLEEGIRRSLEWFGSRLADLPVIS